MFLDRNMSNLAIYVNAVRAKFPEAELRSDGNCYYVVNKQPYANVGVKSFSPQLAWLSAYQHVSNM